MCRTAKGRNTKWITRARLKQALVFLIYQKSQKEEKNSFKAYPDFREEEGKINLNVNNALICQFHFDSGDINVPMGQGKKTLKRNVVSTFEDLKKPVVQSKRKPPAARKVLFEEIVEPSQEQMNNKTQKVLDAFCINCHNYKEEIDKLLKQKTKQQISINKLEEIINKMQKNVNNLHENITKLKNDTEITKSKIFNYEKISQNKEMFKSITGLKADDFQAVFEFLDIGPHCENIKFYDGQNNKKPKSYPQSFKPGKEAKLLAIDQFFTYLS